MGAGAVAPACPADRSRIGMPARMQASIVMQLSVANFIGGTTKQFEFDTKGISRHAASPPATMWISSIHAGRRRRVGKGRADMFRGARQAGVERVEVHLDEVRDLAADHGALEEMDVVEVMGEPRRVVEVRRGRGPVFVR
jgi:hypothetical protein